MFRLSTACQERGRRDTRHPTIHLPTVGQPLAGVRITSWPAKVSFFCGRLVSRIIPALGCGSQRQSCYHRSAGADLIGGPFAPELPHSAGRGKVRLWKRLRRQFFFPCYSFPLTLNPDEVGSGLPTVDRLRRLADGSRSGATHRRLRCSARCRRASSCLRYMRQMSSTSQDRERSRLSASASIHSSNSRSDHRRSVSFPAIDSTRLKNGPTPPLQQGIWGPCLRSDEDRSGDNRSKDVPMPSALVPDTGTPRARR